MVESRAQESRGDPRAPAALRLAAHALRHPDCDGGEGIVRRLALRLALRLAPRGGYCGDPSELGVSRTIKRWSAPPCPDVARSGCSWRRRSRPTRSCRSLTLSGGPAPSRIRDGGMATAVACRSAGSVARDRVRLPHPADNVLRLFSQADGVRSRVNVRLRVDRSLRAARVGGMITALVFLGHPPGGPRRRRRLPARYVGDRPDR